MKIRNLFAYCVLLFSTINYAQQKKGFWTSATLQSEVTQEQNKQEASKGIPQKEKVYKLDIKGLKDLLKKTPKRGTAQKKSGLIIEFPTADGNFKSFKTMEAPVMHPDLQKKYPNIRSYAAQSIENPANTMRFAITPNGFESIMLDKAQGVQLIKPTNSNDDQYMVYYYKDFPEEIHTDCLVDDQDGGVLRAMNKSAVSKALLPNDGMLRTYRFAVASNYEYSATVFNPTDTEAQKKASVLAAINTTMTIVNAVLETDLAITLEIVPDNDKVIFVDENDPYDGTDTRSMLRANTRVLDSLIDHSKYDIGHILKWNKGGGVAGLSNLCRHNKGAGVSHGPSKSQILHEIGHQLGAHHTFDNCNSLGGPRYFPYEIGSGSTIMAYASTLCSPYFFGPRGFYYHQASIAQMNNVVLSRTCGTNTPSGNALPTAEAGPSYTIPIGTPYMLVGSSTDDDGTSSHTYTWEQFDLGHKETKYSDTTATGPVARGFEGTHNHIRYIPRIEDYLKVHGSTTWEKLMNISRDINFVLTVRDNDAHGGQTAVDSMKVTTTTTAGPFIVTSQNDTVSWSTGNVETITWDVANTNVGDINATNVDILLSTDGGLTFPFTLATDVPNDGHHDIIVPDVLAEDCLVMVKATDNIFYNFNTGKIAIGYNLLTEGCKTFEFEINQQLPKASWEVFGRNISFPGDIVDLNVTLDIDTENVRGIRFIVRKDDKSASLYSHHCFGGGLQMVFDDEAINTFPDACPVQFDQTKFDTVVPKNPLSVFDTLPAEGYWRFLVTQRDDSVSVLESVTLDVCMENTLLIVLSPVRTHYDTIRVKALSSVGITDTHLTVTSPNTTDPTSIVYTLTQLPSLGTLYLDVGGKKGVKTQVLTPLVIGDTFTQADINNGKVSYTTISAENTFDLFKTDMNDGEEGILPNLTNTIEIMVPSIDSLICSADEDVPVTSSGESNGIATVFATGGNGGYTYLWNNGETTATADSLDAGIHTVTVTDRLKCKTTCEVIVTVFDESKCIYYPNPSSGFMIIHLKEFSVLNVSLTDMKGAVVLSKNFPGNSLIHEIDLTGIPPGIYILIATYDNKKVKKKIVIY